MHLTEGKIRQLAVDEDQRDKLVFDDEQRGLAVRVTASGGRTYLAQYTLAGRKYRVPLGAFSAVSLANAREAAAVIMGEVAKGKNPALELKEAKAAERARMERERLTLSALIGDWEKLHLSQRRKRYADEALRALKYAFKRHLDRPAEELDRATVRRALDTLIRPKEGTEAKRTGSAIAARTAAYGNAAFSWAVKRGTISTNPFADLPIARRSVKRDRTLSDDELVAVWKAADEMTDPYGAIVKLLIVTGQRVNEVAGMRWREISPDLATWTMRGARTKNGNAQIVPLSQPVRDLLRARFPEEANDLGRAIQERGDALVFPGARETPFSGWSKSKRALDENCGVSDWVLHDLRRTLATGMQRCVRLEVTEAILNHVGSRGGIVGVYQQHDWAEEKRTALEAWAAHVKSDIERQTAPSNVVSLR